MRHFRLLLLAWTLFTGVSGLVQADENSVQDKPVSVNETDNQEDNGQSSSSASSAETQEVLKTKTRSNQSND